MPAFQRDMLSCPKPKKLHMLLLTTLRFTWRSAPPHWYMSLIWLMSPELGFRRCPTTLLKAGFTASKLGPWLMLTPPIVDIQSRKKNTSPRHLNVRMLVLGAATLNCMKAEHETCLRFSSAKIRPMQINVKALSGLLQVFKAFIWIVVELLVVGYMNSSGEHADWSSPTSMV